jgi:hypothetical protein
MSLWGNLDAANNVPKQADTTGYGGSTPQVTANGDVYFGNTAIGDFITDAAIGIFGVDTDEQTQSTAGDGGSGVPQHAGWVIRKVGTGPIDSITVNSGAHLVNSYINFSTGFGKAGSGETQANARVYVDGTGAVLNVTLGNTAGIYANTPTIANIYTSLHFVQNTSTLAGKVDETRANAVFTINMGGRANRVQTETIVAMGSMTGDGSNAVFTAG